MGPNASKIKIHQFFSSLSKSGFQKDLKGKEANSGLFHCLFVNLRFLLTMFFFFSSAKYNGCLIAICFEYFSCHMACACFVPDPDCEYDLVGQLVLSILFMCVAGSELSGICLVSDVLAYIAL